MKILKSYMKMEKTIINLSDSKMQKQKYHQHKGPVSIKNVDTDKVIVPNKVPFGKKGFKCFTGQKDDKKIKLSYIFLPKMTPYRNDFDETKYIFL